MATPENTWISTSSYTKNHLFQKTYAKWKWEDKEKGTVRVYSSVCLVSNAWGFSINTGIRAWAGLSNGGDSYNTAVNYNNCGWKNGLSFHSSTGQTKEKELATYERVFTLYKNEERTVVSWGEVQNRSGYMNANLWGSRSITLPEAIFYDFDAPTLSMEKTSCYRNDMVRISWKSAANQGNSELSSYRLYCNGIKIYEGKDTSYTYPAYTKGTMEFTLEEVHDWGNEEKRKSSNSVSLEVQESYSDFATPSISTSKSMVMVGEEILISWKRNQPQGNSPFLFFRLYSSNENGTRKLVFQGKDSSIKIVPSDYLDNPHRGGKLFFTIEECHSWDSKLQINSKTAQVNIRPNGVVVYDEKGNKRIGVVSVYDAKGNRHDALVSVYDSKGKRHDAS